MTWPPLRQAVSSLTLQLGCQAFHVRFQDFAKERRCQCAAEHAVHLQCVVCESIEMFQFLIGERSLTYGAPVFPGAVHVRPTFAHGIYLPRVAGPFLQQVLPKRGRYITKTACPQTLHPKSKAIYPPELLKRRPTERKERKGPKQDKTGQGK